MEREPGAIQNSSTPFNTSSSMACVARMRVWIIGTYAKSLASFMLLLFWRNSASIGLVFKFNSCHSDFAFAAFTTPTPAKRSATLPSVSSPLEIKADLMATQNSAPSESIHPSGPAYKPRSNVSDCRTVCIARSRGYPHTRSRMQRPYDVRFIDLLVDLYRSAAYKCCTDTCRKIPFSSSLNTPALPSRAIFASDFEHLLSR